jgi:hypothetical protein
LKLQAPESSIYANGAIDLGKKKKEERERGEGEGSRGAELGVHDPQQGRAHHQRHIAHEPGTYPLFFLI